MKPNKNSLEIQLGLVSAPEDFPIRSLSNLDSTLRCPICKEFYQAPVLIHIPKCCHTFCSACIRTCFNNDSNNQKIKATGLGGVGNSHRCPICKVEAQEEKIKPVPSLETATICWQEAREEILHLINRLQSLEIQLKQAASHPSSIPNTSTNTCSRISPPNQTQTRPAAKNNCPTASPKKQIPSFFHNNLHDSKSSKANATPPPKKRKLPGQSLGQQQDSQDIQLLSYNPTDPTAPVQCPICQKHMLNSNMDLHITQCLTEKEKIQPTSTSSSKAIGKNIKKNSLKDQEGTKPNQTRIPLPHFSSLKPKEIKVELMRHDLNLMGTTTEQIRRLSKYITLFNANLDAQIIHQKSIECIKNQVYNWENLLDHENIKLDTKNKKILNNNHKDYLKKNKHHFDLLIDQASKSIQKSKTNVNHPSTTQPQEAPLEEVNPQEQPENQSNESSSNNNSIVPSTAQVCAPCIKEIDNQNQCKD